MLILEGNRVLKSKSVLTIPVEGLGIARHSNIKDMYCFKID